MRSQSGRRHAITTMVAAGVDEAAGMAFANMRSRKVHSSYADIEEACTCTCRLENPSVQAGSLASDACRWCAIQAGVVTGGSPCFVTFSLGGGLERVRLG